MLEIKGDKFYLNNKMFNIYSGAIHYFRVVPEYWKDRLLKLKLAGFNTVETYVCWNLHEPQKGNFDFNGMLDMEKFILEAKALGLYVIVRPSPYICAEWDFGGLPAWLLQYDVNIRCADETYLKHVKDYYKVLMKKLVPHQITHGGNIIAMQIENEYGSYGNDKEYIKFIEKTMVDCGVNVLLFTSDGPCDSMLTGGTLPNVFRTVNFGSQTKEAFGKLVEYQPNKPLMCMEFWNGWFDHWSEANHTRDCESVVAELNIMLKMNANFNFYMFCGGTNFGFSSGANHEKCYEPTVTSYDYDALINEWGGYTPKYHAVREVLLKHQNLPLIPLPEEPKRQNIGEIRLDYIGSLMDNVQTLGKKHTSIVPKSMEQLGQNFGFMLYRCNLDGAYEATKLQINGLRDRAYIFVNKEYKGMIYRNDEKQYLEIEGIPSGGAVVDILVEAMGRVNYGVHLQDRKGILESVSIGNQKLYHWEIYTLPLDNIKSVVYNEDNRLPAFLKGSFSATSKDDCFVHLDGFTKGNVFVNGFNLGRYWNIGPQKSLYLPGVILKDENDIVIFELENYCKNAIEIRDYHLIQ